MVCAASKCALLLVRLMPWVLTLQVSSGKRSSPASPLAAGPAGQSPSPPDVYLVRRRVSNKFCACAGPVLY